MSKNFTKKLVTLLLCAVMVLECIVPATVAHAESPNLIKNPGFNDVNNDGKIDDWGLWYGSSEPAEVSASNSVLSFHAVEQRMIVNQVVKVEPLKSYTLAAEYQVKNCKKGAFMIEYQMLDQNKKNVGSKINVVKQQSDLKWNKVDKVIEVPENVSYVKVELAVGTPATMDANVKSISLKLNGEIEKPEEVVNLIKNPEYANSSIDKINDWNYYPAYGKDYNASVENGVFTGNVENGALTLHQTVKLNADQLNRKYEFTGEVSASNLSSGAEYRIQLVNKQNRGIRTVNPTVKVKGDAQWEKESLIVSVPAVADGEEVAGVKIEQRVLKGTGSASFRNVVLKDIGEADKEPEIDSCDSIIKNGGYELVDGTYPAKWNVWESTGGLAVSVDKNIKKTGNSSVHITNKVSGKDSRGALHQTVSPVPADLQGKAVKISQWIKTKDFVGKGLSMRLQYGTVSGEKVDLTGYFIDLEKTQDWTYIEFVLPLPKQALKTLKVEYLYDSSQGDVWIDNTRVEKSVPVDKIETAVSYHVLKAGETGKIDYTVIPEDASNKEVSFKVEDETVVSVDELGNIKALKDGVTKIIISSTNGISTEVGIVVSENEVKEEVLPTLSMVQGEHAEGTVSDNGSYEILRKPQHGNLFINNNVYSYYTDADQYGKYEAAFVATENGSIRVKRLPIEISKKNSNPEFKDIIVETVVNTDKKFRAIASDADQDKLKFTIEKMPENGVIELVEDGNAVYRPGKDFTGYDKAVLKAEDTNGGSALSNVTIYVAPDKDVLLASVKTEHPRILASQSDFDRIKGQVKTDENMKKWYVDIINRADALLDKPVVPRNLPDGVRMDTTGSKYVVDLAFAYKISGDQRYFERTCKELKSLCEYTDWNPSHLLDTAMTANGVAIAYDWLYNDFSNEDRQLVEKALFEKSLQTGLKQYQGNHRFVTDGFNWNYVCNTGFATTALAIGNHENAEYRDVAKDVLQRAYCSIQYGLPQYAPEGDSIEGISYWDYGTRYLVSFLASVSSATTTENEFLNTPGLKETALYPIYMSGKAGVYNYSDNDVNLPVVGYLNLWFASAYNMPSYTWYHKNYMAQGNKATVYDMLYYNADAYKASAPQQLDRSYKSQSVVTMRHDFDDENSSFLGFKGGLNGAPHGDIDIGSFVYDLNGVRWAIDFGKENYNLPGYWETASNGKRWNYYRKNALGHNTLIINPENGANQKTDAYAPIVEKKLNEKNGGYGIIDMSEAYQKNALDVKRGFLYINRDQVLVRDEFLLKETSDIYWQMHTDAIATVSEDGKTVNLSKDGKEIQLHIIDENGSDHKFETMAAKPYEGLKTYDGENANEGYTKIFIKDVTQKGVFNVFIASENRLNPDFEITSLSNWKNIDFTSEKHDLVYVPGKAPTATENGIKEHWHCEKCGKNFADKEGKVEIEDIIIPATGEVEPPVQIDNSITVKFTRKNFIGTSVKTYTIDKDGTVKVPSAESYSWKSDKVWVSDSGNTVVEPKATLTYEELAKAEFAGNVPEKAVVKFTVIKKDEVKPPVDPDKPEISEKHIDIKFVSRTFLGKEEFVIKTVKEGESINAPKIKKIGFMGKKKVWQSDDGYIRLESEQKISYEELRTAMGGNIYDDAKITFHIVNR